ncbi:DUF7311 family protein [Halegenticoccus soli]|uniref:DUF7311 family protein n=1 Tax=Halegenticoccus soli TaxID=1985678 RepID=UPI000C6D2B60|nr:ABC transporter [Halegenticoccus soli]
MIRIVLAAALTVALFAASLPAVDDARADRTAARLDADLDRFERTARDLAAREDPVEPGTPGARRTVEIRLPGRSWTAEPVEAVRIGCPRPRCRSATVTYRLSGGSVERRRVDGVALRTPGGAISLREPGVHRLRMTLERRNGAPTVIVRRSRGGI